MTTLARVAAPPDIGARLLTTFACVMVATAPLEGYLMVLHPHLAKLPAILLATTWITVRLRQRRMPTAHPVHAVLAGLATVLLVTSAVHAAEPFALEYLVRWLPFLVITVILVDVASTDVPIRSLLVAAVSGAAAAGVGALFSMLVLGEPRATGPLEDPNDLAYVLVAALPLLVPLSTSKRYVRRGTLVVVALLLALGTAATFSRGGALALAAGIGWLVLRHAVRKRVVAAAGAVLVSAGLIGALASSAELDRALQEKTYIAGTNVDTRELRWQASARMLAENPVLGVGPGGFRGAYASASNNAEIDEQEPVAHNMYMEVAAELGLPGFALFLGLVGVAAVSGERALRVARHRRLVVPVQASLLAALVASTFLSQQYYLPLWFLVALLCAADLRARSGRSGWRGGDRARLAGHQ